jgi:drug/metabolite transporter (DMT)-like permease
VTESAKGQGAVLATAVLWSTSGLFIKILPWHPLLIAGGRSLLAVGVLLLLRPLIAVPGQRGKHGQHDYREHRYFLASGFAYFATLVLFVIANKLTTSANAILLQYGAPVWGTLLGWLWVGEKPRRENWGALGAVLLGLVVFFKDSLGTGNFLGDLLAAISGVTFGAHSVFMRLQKNGNPSDSMILAHALTVAVSVPFLFMAPPVITSGSMGAILFMGLFQIGLASFLFSYGLKRIPVMQTLMLCVIEPVLNPTWVLLVTGERPRMSAVLGGGIIIFSVMASALIGRLRAHSHTNVP